MLLRNGNAKIELVSEPTGRFEPDYPPAKTLDAVQRRCRFSQALHSSPVKSCSRNVGSA